MSSGGVVSSEQLQLDPGTAGLGPSGRSRHGSLGAEPVLWEHQAPSRWAQWFRGDPKGSSFGRAQPLPSPVQPGGMQEPGSI